MRLAIDTMPLLCKSGKKSYVLDTIGLFHSGSDSMSFTSLIGIFWIRSFQQYRISNQNLFFIFLAMF